MSCVGAYSAWGSPATCFPGRLVGQREKVLKAGPGRTNGEEQSSCWFSCLTGEIRVSGDLPRAVRWVLETMSLEATGQSGILLPVSASEAGLLTW